MERSKLFDIAFHHEEGERGEKTSINKNPYHCIKTSFENTNSDWGENIRLNFLWWKSILNRKFRALVLRIRTDVTSGIIECKHHDVAEMACERHMQTSNHAQSTRSVYGTKGKEDGFPMHSVSIWGKKRLPNSGKFI